MAALVITPTSVINSTAAVQTGTLGETATAGQAVYLKAADGRLWLAQADGTAAEAVVVGVLLNGGGAGQPAQYVTGGGAFNVGATTTKIHYFLHTTAGGIGPFADLTSGHAISRIGYATATDGTFVMDIKNTGSTV